MRFWETPVYIPNTMVKPEAADGTMPGTAWESRWLPGLENYRVTSVSIYCSKYLENCIQKEIRSI